MGPFLFNIFIFYEDEKKMKKKNRNGPIFR